MFSSMDEAKIKFGDKIFIYGEFMTYIEELSDYEYNTVRGYTFKGGYDIYPVPTPDPDVSIPGFVVDFLSSDSLASQTPFYQMEMVDVTDKLSKDLPLPSNTKVWMPTKHLQQPY